jgi:hypothetical protein
MDQQTRQILRLAPLWVFSAVTGRAGRFDPLEEEAFWRCLETAALMADGTTFDVLSSAATDRAQVVADFVLDGRPTASGLLGVADALDSLPLDEAALLRDVLVHDIAEGVARARGPFGRTVSREDQVMVTLVTQMLAESDEANPLDSPTPV